MLLIYCHREVAESGMAATRMVGARKQAVERGSSERWRSWYSSILLLAGVSVYLASFFRGSSGLKCYTHIPADAAILLPQIHPASMHRGACVNEDVYCSTICSCRKLETTQLFTGDSTTYIYIFFSHIYIYIYI